MRTISLLAGVFSLIMFSCTSSSTRNSGREIASDLMVADPYVWLEDANKDARVMPWVLEHNEITLKELGSDPRAAAMSAAIRKIVTAQDRIASPELVAGKIRNFWQDSEHERGIWRQTSTAEYSKADTKWETILDIDQLNNKENKSWVFKGANCLEPDQDLCLLHLSDGGRDKVEVREFQVSSKSFVSGGFFIPEGKTDVSWIDRDHIFIGTDFGPGTLTSSGYPRQVRILKRGDGLDHARIVFEGKATDVSVSGVPIRRPEMKVNLINESFTFFDNDYYLLNETFELKKLPLPRSAILRGAFHDRLIVSLRDDWKVGKKIMSGGSIVALPLKGFDQPRALDRLETIFVPNEKMSVESVSFTNHFILLSLLNNVRGEIYRISKVKNAWKRSRFQLPSTGSVEIITTDSFDKNDSAFVSYNSFNEPSTLYFGSGRDLGTHLKVAKKSPDRFDASDIVVEQFEALSVDGTKVPYFMVHKKSMPLDGSNPTLLYGYGGFEISMRPTYSGVIGKLWLEKGGVYVLANIRGGGEFGPRWHTAALRENRQRAYDDFYAVTQDLFVRKVTTPRRLGIKGGSNGGLLVGVAVTEHPEAYHAVLCESALLDMLRYTLLPPGASWIGEYGDPVNEPKIATAIAHYSPYQNIHAGVHYPKIFFHTSHADDRVQPGHTRKTVARFEEFGDNVLMFEKTEGGHGGAADPEQTVQKSMLEFVYLYQQLRD